MNKNVLLRTRSCTSTAEQPEVGQEMNTDDTARRIAAATEYRLNHIRRILKAIDPPEYAKTQMVIEQFKIPQENASLIVCMAQHDLEPLEDTPTGMNNLYVILLDEAVLERRKFRELNPGYRYRWQKPCVYVGVTAYHPKKRFEKHKAGVQHSRTVKKYGRCLMPELYKHLNPVPSTEGKDHERGLAESLRRKGYAVWQF